MVMVAQLWEHSERMNVKMDNGLTVYKNRILTCHLQQSAQETNPLSVVTNPESQPAISKSVLQEVRPLYLSNNWFSKPGKNTCNNWPQGARI